MKRLDTLRAVYDRLTPHLVVTIMGAVAAELHDLGHRPNFLYLQHGMGLASSTGLGIALSLPREKVIVLDGDGSVLMNLGGLSTLGRYQPRNLVHVIYDNGSLLSVGGFPTATLAGTDLEQVARGCGVRRTATVENVEDFVSQFESALAADELSVIVAKVEPVGPPSFLMDVSVWENRFEFQRYLASVRKRG